MEFEKYTDAQIAYIVSLREDSQLGWAEIVEKYNEKYDPERSFDSLKQAYYKNRSRLDDTNEYVKVLRDVARTKKANSYNAKDLKKILEEWEKREDVLEAIRSAAQGVNKLAKPSPIKFPKPSKHTKHMTLELLVSDVHVGKKTDTFNLEVLKRRLKQISDTAIKEIQRASEHYIIDRIVVVFIGDLIESSSMHGPESLKGCEFGNSRQIQEALTNIYHLLIAPICSVGIAVDIIGVTGNHDRTEPERTFHNPGEENTSWIVYKAMEEFTKLSGFKNVTWAIPTDPFYLYEIYGEKVIYEHFENAKGDNLRKSLENLLSRRIGQLKTPIKFIRGGHFHEPAEFGLGKIVVNGSVPGNDSYSSVLGFDCEPTQTLNFYIEREKNDSIKRQTSFYKRFLIQLN